LFLLLLVDISSDEAGTMSGLPGLSRDKIPAYLRSLGKFIVVVVDDVLLTLIIIIIIVIFIILLSMLLSVIINI